jgi:hypothetical protein
MPSARRTNGSRYSRQLQSLRQLPRKPTAMAWSRPRPRIVATPLTNGDAKGASPLPAAGVAKPTSTSASATRKTARFITAATPTQTMRYQAQPDVSIGTPTWSGRSSAARRLAYPRRTRSGENRMRYEDACAQPPDATEHHFDGRRSASKNDAKRFRCAASRVHGPSPFSPYNNARQPENSEVRPVPWREDVHGMRPRVPLDQVEQHIPRDVEEGRVNRHLPRSRRLIPIDATEAKLDAGPGQEGVPGPSSGDHGLPRDAIAD